MEKIKVEADGGYPFLTGVHRIEGGMYSFTVSTAEGEDAALVLYKKNERQPHAEIPFSDGSRFGSVQALRVRGLRADKFQYNFRIGGKICTDPFANQVIGREHFGEPWPEDPHAVRCGLLALRAFDWEGDTGISHAWEDLVLYKLHVRGFTKLCPFVPKHLRGTFAGMAAAIPYLKKLGVNAVVLMPAYDFFEVDRENPDTVNYWGYTGHAAYFAPKASYCSSASGQREFREMVRELHKNGIECLMEFDFPKEIAPLTALRVVQFWAGYYHVDGFWLRGEGVPMNLLARDYNLTASRLIYDRYDQVQTEEGLEPRNRKLGLYDQGGLYDLRRFLLGEKKTLSIGCKRIRRKDPLFATVNCLTNEEGFTLADLYMYADPHNEANGKEGLDGSSYNLSFNFGVEGPTRKKEVQNNRFRQMRGAILLLLLSAGTPMLYAGDESGNSQGGNNHAWCQDNAISWMDWKKKAGMDVFFDFVCAALVFRKEHPCLYHPDHSYELFPERGSILPFEPENRSLGICVRLGEEMLYIGVNFSEWERETILPAGVRWRLICDTYEKNQNFRIREEWTEDFLRIPEHTIRVLERMPDQKETRTAEGRKERVVNERI